MKSLLLPLFLLVALPSLLLGKPVEVGSEGFHFDLPETWKIENNAPPAIFVATSPDQSSLVAVVMVPNDNNLAGDNPSFINGVKKGMRGKLEPMGITLNVGEEGPVTLNGVPAYRFKSTLDKDGKPAYYCQQYSIAANGKLYLIKLQDASADSDAAQTAIANSLTFTTPPTLPTPSAHNADYEAGYKAGQLLGYGLAILAVIAIVRLIFRKSKPAA